MSDRRQTADRLTAARVTRPIITIMIMVMIRIQLAVDFDFFLISFEILR
jgi:hypothetical protein